MQIKNNTSKRRSTNKVGYLEYIDSPDDIKKLSIDELNQLSDEIREFLLEKVSKTGGHLASNLGVVELTLAMHNVFDTKKDKIVWDVGHQSYVHKIVTGRKDKFDTLRKLNGLSGFPKTCESKHDCFNTGHSSTSISAALGMAKARDMKNEDYSVVAVIGDGAFTGGMAFEALNDGGRLNSNFIVILNDNEMSITPNVGGLSRSFSKMRTGPFYTKTKEDIDNFLDKLPNLGGKTREAIRRIKGTIKYLITPGAIFESFGYKYYGPIDGHNIEELTMALNTAKRSKKPVFIHVFTQKGKGYSFAEERPDRFHGIAPFEVETGETLAKGGSPDYSSVFGAALCKEADINNRIVAISASMVTGTGLSEFSKQYPKRLFDVGIAEQHAVTSAAGLAMNGMLPVVARYSSFLQRAYDQIIHDVATQKLHVIFAIDRAGIVGEDGETHQGVFDLSFLSHIPNMTIMAPADYNELRDMLHYAIYNTTGPVAIRYPRGRGLESIGQYHPVNSATSVTLSEGTDICLLAVGSMVKNAVEAAEILKSKGVSAGVINARFVKPLDCNAIVACAKKYNKIITIEDNSLMGGFGSNVISLLNARDIYCRVKTLGLPDDFINHGTRNELIKLVGLDSNSIAEVAMEMCKE